MSQPVSPRVDLPATALLEKDGKTQVWIVDPATKKVALRDVTVVTRDEGSVAVTGLAAGDRVVTAGVHSLTPGQTVKVPAGEAVNRFNLSEWALGHRSFVWYLMLVFVIAGVLSYLNLGREEDPAFTIKTMIIQANWPGATVEEITNQVTDRIEKKLEELDAPRLHQELHHARPDHDLRQPEGHHQGRDVPATWVQVRNMIDDIRAAVAARRAGAVLQRPVRRRLRQHLRLHRPTG